MSFNMGAYQQATNTASDIREAESEAQAQAAEKQAKTEEFKFDETQKFKAKAKKAQSMFQGWKGGVGLAAMIGASMLGLGPVAAAAMSAVGTGIGGAYGRGKAKDELKGRFFKGNQDAALESMDKSIMTDMIMSGIMGGIGGDAVKGAKASGFKGIGEFTKGLSGQSGTLMAGKTLFDTLGLTKQDQQWGQP